MNRVASWLFLAGLLSLPFGCEVIAGIEVRDEAVRPHPVDASVDGKVVEAGIDASDEVSASCLEHPPGPPTLLNDAGDDGGVELVMALRSLDFGAPAQAGFDLDGVATACSDGYAAEPSACELPGVEFQHAWCDGECGRDLAGNALLAEPAAAALGLGELSKSMENGELGLILRVGEYNGLENDDAVAVASFVSAGTALLADGGRPKPQWDGTDEWTAVDTLATKKAGYLYSLTNAQTAYVTDGVLVAKFDSLQLGFSARSGRLTVFEIDHAVLTGRVQAADAQAYSITDGRIGGAATVSKMLRLLQSLPLDGAFPYLCPGVVAYDYIKEDACKRVDLRFSSTGENAACNALGLGVSFTASTALLATELSTVPIASPGCNDGGGASDDCF